MYHYILALLFISTYSGSLGKPTPAAPARSPYNGTISALLRAVASKCPSTFVKEQIEAQLKECNVSADIHGKHQLSCMMFFDINKQLCEANFTAPENFTNNVNEFIDVPSVCVQAHNWTVSNFTGLPWYKEKVEVALKSNTSCKKLCENDEVLSDDTNFFCKYFKWGREMLIPVSAVNNDVVSNPNVVSGSNTNGHATSSSSSQLVSNLIQQDVNKPNVVTNSLHVDETLKLNEPQVKVPSHEVKPSLDPGLVLDSDTADVEVPNIDNEHMNHVKDTEKPGQNPREEVHIENPLSQAGDHNPATSSKQPDQKGQEENPEIAMHESQNHASGQLGHPVLNGQNAESERANGGGDGDDYQDSDEIRDDGMAAGKDGADKQEEQGDTNAGHQQEQQKITGDSIKNSLEEKEFYTNTMDDDDDHFFPFFLTAVIMVVLLYVLYHNKSKVSKVVLGLIVEGRQPGRRRNSRGHAYKRLDTLEQAMSTSSTAPPSKIIY